MGAKTRKKNQITETRKTDAPLEIQSQFGEGTAQSPKSGGSHIHLRPLVAAHVYWDEMTQAKGVICPQ